jgi:hypothetical protein
LKLHFGEQSLSAIFSPEAREQEFKPGQGSRQHQLLTYLTEGIWHIWIGFDHILFLVALLLPAVVIRREGRWAPVEAGRPALLQVVKVVTAFTVAHSITLTLAALDFISLPSRLVESVIAASVVVAALNNVKPIFQERRWAMAFAFGLIHGFGFASVLGDLGLPQGAKLLALVGFNLGVEVGQLAIVAALFPLAFLLRSTRFYLRGVLIGGSLLIAVLALAWLIERAFDMKFLPF